MKNKNSLEAKNFVNFWSVLSKYDKKHPWQSGRLHRTHNAISKEQRWFKPNWMQKKNRLVMSLLPEALIFRGDRNGLNERKTTTKIKKTRLSIH